MKASELTSALVTLVNAKQPAFIFGKPGVGKTSIISQVAKTIGFDLHVSRLALMDPVDLRGLPAINGDTTRWLVPSDFPREGCNPTIWFFDEWLQGMPSVQNAAGQLLNERRLGDYRLPDSVVIMAASNRMKDRAATNKMPSHIADRFCFLELDADRKDWTHWALGAGIRTEVIAFIQFRDELLSAFDPASQSCPSPRSWEKVSAVLDQSPPTQVEQAIYTGLVGEGAAIEFIGFLRIFRTLPSPDSILLNPSSADVPTDPATLYALAGSLARRATDVNFDRVTRYLERLPDEFSVLCVQQAIQRDGGLQNTRAFIEWATRHQSALN